MYQRRYPLSPTIYVYLRNEPAAIEKMLVREEALIVAEKNAAAAAEAEAAANLSAKAAARAGGIEAAEDLARAEEAGKGQQGTAGLLDWRWVGRATASGRWTTHGVSFPEPNLDPGRWTTHGVSFTEPNLDPGR
jgi:hypothetical protein